MKIRYEEPAWLTKWITAQPGEGPLEVDSLPAAQARRMLMIGKAVTILEEYEGKGFNLTLRQLYYQFVARDLLANSDRNYKRLGSAVSDGRMWGFIDWNHLVDRGRNFESLGHWDHPRDIIRSSAHSFAVDRWEGEDYRLEVWVEKQALEDIVDRACSPLDVGYLACKGYMSQSEMWSASQRLKHHERQGQKTIILHLGDHDPSGMDMSRDIQDRLAIFESSVTVERIALNMDQINTYNPPPNPAKVTDSRAGEYIARYGENSWELDALNPETMTELIQSEIAKYKGPAYLSNSRRQELGRDQLQRVSRNWSTAVQAVEDLDNS